MTTTPATNGTKKKVARTVSSLPSPQQIIAKCQATWNQPRKTRSGFNYKYADLAQLIEIVTDFLIKEFGASFRQPTSFFRRKGSLYVRVRNILWAPGGEQIEDVMDYPVHIYKKGGEPVGPDMQEAGSAITYARRYSMLSFFGFAQEDDDGERASKKRTPASKQPKLTEPDDNGKSNSNGVKPRPWLTMKLDGKNTRYRFQSAPEGKASIVLMGSFGQGQELPRVPTKQGIGNITLTHMLGRPVKGGEQWLFDFKAVGK